MTLPQKVAVIGGGRMGSGIAHAFLTAGADVVVIEVNEDAASAARDRVASAVQKSAERGKLAGTPDEVNQRLQLSTDFAVLDDRELVVEAVPEDWRLKVDTLTRVESVVSEDAVIATNTSSLSVTGLGRELKRPERFLGLHFFNPVPASTLIEVVLAPATSGQLREDSPRLVESLGKTPVIVNDAPGFATSRLGVAIALEAMRMVEDGVASAHDIDLAMELGYRHPSGPLKTTDIVGLDVRLGIAEYLHETLGERFTPPQILRDKVARGELGRKTGRGFYSWD